MPAKGHCGRCGRARHASAAWRHSWAATGLSSSGLVVARSLKMHNDDDGKRLENSRTQLSPRPETKGDGRSQSAARAQTPPAGGEAARAGTAATSSQSRLGHRLGGALMGIGDCRGLTLRADQSLKNKANPTTTALATKMHLCKYTISRPRVAASQSSGSNLPRTLARPL